MEINRETILHIANLAKLKLEDHEIEKFQSEMNNILKYVSQIDGVSVDGITNIHNLNDYKREVLQDDKVSSFENVAKLFQNAGDRFKNGFITTSKIINKD